MVGPASVAAATVATTSKAPGREQNASAGTHTLATQNRLPLPRSSQMLRKNLNQRTGLHLQHTTIVLLRF